MPERTLVGILIREVSADEAGAIKQNLDGIEWAEEWWSWEYYPAEHCIRAQAKVELEDSQDPELDWLSSHVWDCTDGFCEVYLMLNPAEPSERVFLAGQKEYAEYQEMLTEAE